MIFSYKKLNFGTCTRRNMAIPLALEVDFGFFLLFPSDTIELYWGPLDLDLFEAIDFLPNFLFDPPLLLPRDIFPLRKKFGLPRTYPLKYML